ncbi:MAG: phosphate ABC transporter substrate-binding protein PstS [Nitrososphaerota archaeon]|nr:phosphate ABC transporter substrate-binding protein PstS [Nitrososphaerota archaeon]
MKFERKAISTAAIAAIVVVVIVVVGAGAYVASSGSKTTTVTSTSISTTTNTLTSTSISVSTSVGTSTQTGVGQPVLPSSLAAETISETGSTLLYPLFNLWVPNFTATYPTIKINTAGTGSGTGISSAGAGTVQIGASDAYLTPAQAGQYPNLLNIPLAISAQQINYNLPMIPATTHLNMTGNILAQIYNGTITYWNDPQIVAVNPGVASLLPHDTIIPLHRSDGSGDTFIFTTYLSDTNTWWNKNVGFATSVSWPSLPSGQAALGNGGMVQAASQTEYSIAYIGISYLQNAVKAGLGYAYLQNRAGNFVDITQANIQSAVNAMTSSTPPDETLSLVYAPGTNSYPIINYEYAIVSKTQSDSGMAQAVRTLLNWAIMGNGGNSLSFLNQVGFVPLPASTQALSWAQVAQIGP